MHIKISDTINNKIFYHNWLLDWFLQIIISKREVGVDEGTK